MKRILLGLLFSMLPALLLGCGGESGGLAGKWKKVDGKPKAAVLELTSQQTWKYTVDGKVAETGTYVLKGDRFIMKHDPVAHHDDGDHKHREGTGHSHGTPPDHEYKYSLSGDKKELKIIHGNKTSVYKKM